jgi:hypothetical protein
LQQHSRTTGAAPLTLVQAAQAIMKRPRGFLEFYVSYPFFCTTCSLRLFCVWF